MYLKKLRIHLLAAAMLILVSLGCSSGPVTAPSEAPQPAVRDSLADPGRVLWGYYEIYVDPSSGVFDITPLRETSMHLNALKYLETPTTTNVTVEGPLKFNNGKITVNIGITHPLPQKIYTGFDVRGIVISRGSYDLGGGYIVPGPGDFRLLNADGYTRYWNPTEFSGTGYQDGKLGTPNSVGKFNATVNGYKYFADGLGANDDFKTFTSMLRGAFTSLTKNIRRYEMLVGSYGMVFNYAVDASWAMPDNTPPVIPGDFDVEKANCKEAWKVVPHLSPEFTATGAGTCTAQVDVYDWQGMTSIQGVYLQAPDLFAGSKTFTGPVDNGDHFTYSLTFADELSAIGTHLLLLIRVTDTGVSTNQYLESFQVDFIDIGEVVITLPEDEHYKKPGADYLMAWKAFDMATEAPAVDYQDNNGPWDFTDDNLDNIDHRTSFAKDAPEVAGIVNDFPSEVEYFFREGEDTNAIFRPEAHIEASNALYLYGLYSQELFDGSIVFPSPASYPYPVDKNTEFTITKKITVVPVMFIINIDFHTKALGQGYARVPLYGGAWHNCILMRSTIELSSSGLLGEGWMGTSLALEWIDNDGTVVATAVTGNAKDETPNFNESTFEITGEVEFMGLKDINKF